jgi:hypothetical protein
MAALGFFDPTKGAQIVLWDLKVIIEFPPGAQILIPSAILYHSNASIQQGEERYSFTQYCSGPLFRWVDTGFKLVNKLEGDEKEAFQKLKDERNVDPLALLPTLDDLVGKDVDADAFIYKGNS